MVCRPLLVEGVLHVLRSWDTGGEKTAGLRKACDQSVFSSGHFERLSS